MRLTYSLDPVRRFRKARTIWSRLGKRDPYWAVLAHPDKAGHRWGAEEFYQTGIKETDSLMSYLASRGVGAGRRRCLDFGCGVGRMSRTLAGYFDEVEGIDISPGMIELARRNVGKDNCRFQLLSNNDLSLFDDGHFDLIVSWLALFLNHPEDQKRYLREFLRLLSPGGCAVFHLVEEKLIPDVKTFFKFRFPYVYRLACDALGKYPDICAFGIYSLPNDEVVKLVEGASGRIADRLYDESALGRNYRTYRYCLVKT